MPYTQPCCALRVQAGRIAYPRPIMRRVLVRTDTGTLPVGWAKGSPELDWLCITEHPMLSPDGRDKPGALWLQRSAAFSGAAPRIARGERILQIECAVNDNDELMHAASTVM